VEAYPILDKRETKKNLNQKEPSEEPKNRTRDPAKKKKKKIRTMEARLSCMTA
jgi:hypothetical protein